MRTFVSIDTPYNDAMETVFKLLENQSWCRPVDRKTMHMTLHFYGELNQDAVEELKKKLDSFEFETFDYRIRGIGFFPNDTYIKVIWFGLESEMIGSFYNKLKKTLDFKETLPFVPHVTVARVSYRVDPNVKAELTKLKETVFGQGRCTSVKLMKSELLPTGPVYTELYEKKLKDV